MEKKKLESFQKVKPDDKNIDKICDVWYRYGIMKLEAFDEKVKSQIWAEARDQIKLLMSNNHMNQCI